MKAVLLVALVASPFASPTIPDMRATANRMDPAVEAYAQCFGEALDEQLGVAFAVDTCVELERPLFERYGAGDDRTSFRIRLAKIMQRVFGK